MPFVLDDTEVNTPVYEKLLRPPRMRKPRRSALALRVLRLEASFRLLQKRLLEDAAVSTQAAETVTGFSFPKPSADKAKPRARR